MGKFDNIKKVKDSAAMTEQTAEEENTTKKKLIDLDIKHEELIKQLIKEQTHIGTITSYIKLAVINQLKNDGKL
jgi:hypothetical protein